MNEDKPDWRPYVPTPSQPWDFSRAKHLHRRATLGATWEELHRSVEEGPEKSIDRLLAGRSRSYATRDDFHEMSKLIGDAAVGSSDPNRLKAWWLFHMLFSPDPLGEQLTLMWHNHFATSNLKVQDLQMMRVQNDLFRQHAKGNFGDLLTDVLRDLALLDWLDADSNRKQHPNENLARELLELFTLGVGNYTEQDVREAARALSGWTVRRDQVVQREDRHDGGEKTILGQRGNFGVDDLAKILLQSEATSERLAWRLCDHFMGERVVSDLAINQLASGLRENDLDIGWAIGTILRSQLFFADENMGSQISSPVGYAVSTIRSLEMLDKPPSTLILARWCSKLGQDLFYPPNVGGWSGGRSWLTSRTIVARSNFAAALVAGDLRFPSEPPTLEQLASKIQASGEELEPADIFARLLLSKMPDAKSLETVSSDDLGVLITRLLNRPEAVLN